MSILFRKSFLAFVVCWICSPFLLPAQFLEGPDATRLVPEAATIWLDENNGSIQFAELREEVSLDETEALAWISAILNLRPTEELVQHEIKKDALGFTHLRYRQHYQGVPVLHGRYYLHFQTGRLSSANGEWYPNIQLSPTPTISQTTARTAAESYIGASSYGWGQPPSAGELFVYWASDQAYHLVYRFDVKSNEPFGRAFVMVDANSGAVVGQEERIHAAESEGMAETKYRGTQSMKTDSLAPAAYRLRDYSRAGGVLTYDLNQTTWYNTAADFADADNHWDDTTNQDDAAYDAHWGTQQTYDYFLNIHNRDSYDGNGSPLLSYVHYSLNYVNAFWNGSAMSYGDGDGDSISAFTSLDIVAHEITHGITEYSAGLVYANESGAINESFSDIFGIVLDYYADSANANWLIGEQFGPGFRNAANPNEFQHPDTKGGDFWYTGNVNVGGVHINSGVMNHWFYLLVNGGTGVNDHGDAYCVTGIGMEKAAAIAYRTLTVYLTPNSNYIFTRYYSILATNNLFGGTSQERLSVNLAWEAVGIYNSYDIPSTDVIANFSASQTISCDTPTTVYFVNTSQNGHTYAWDFGDGSSSTLPNPTHTYDSLGTYIITLISNGIGTCSGPDTLVRSNFISISHQRGPISTICAPTSPSGGFQGVGIYSVKLGNINQSSISGAEGYQDFSCEIQDTLFQGVRYPLTILTGNAVPEDVKVWIDFNDDGSFQDSSELVFTSLNTWKKHHGHLLIPGGVALNTPLRMRVGSDQAGQGLQTCSLPLYGQFEDYGLTIFSYEASPEADFSTNFQAIYPGETIGFQDISQHMPTNWKWSFPGGIPASSTEQHPTVFYPGGGIYPIKLIVANDFGVDSITKTNYVYVLEPDQFFSNCEDSISHSLQGVLYDSGGRDEAYSRDEHCRFTIWPYCADTIFLSFGQFDIFNGIPYAGDVVRIFDGPPDYYNYNLIYSGNGIQLPDPLIATSGSVTISLNSSNHPFVAQGFELLWRSSVLPNVPPVAQFGAPINEIPLHVPVSFFDSSLHNPVFWQWDFGDGNISTKRHPAHAYGIPGTYDVRLIVDNCIAKDTLVQSVTVGEAPSIRVIPNSLDLAVTTCDEEVVVELMLINEGQGSLVYEASAQFNEYCMGMWYEDFEDASLVGWEPGNPAIVFPGFSEIDPIEGEYSLKLATSYLGAGYDLRHSFPPQQISEFGFYIKPPASTSERAFVYLGGAPNSWVYQGIFLLSANNGYFRLFGGESTPGDNIFYNPAIRRWHKIDLKNINFSTKTYDVYHDGILVSPGFQFRNQEDTVVSQLSLFTESNAVALYDRMRIGGVDPAFWISFQESAGLTLPGDTSFLSVTLSWEEYQEIYRGDIELQTNDPLRPVIRIPVRFEAANGDAEMRVSQTCIDSLIQEPFETSYHSIIVTNDGCDELIFSTLTTYQAFSAPSNGYHRVLPGESTSIPIRFSPLLPGTYLDTLLLISNVGTQSICLEGFATGEPQTYNTSTNTREPTFSLYPNPTDGNFWLDYQTQNSQICLEVSNALGQIVLEESIAQAFSLHHLIVLPPGLSEGVYVVKVLDGEEQMRGRIVLRR